MPGMKTGLAYKLACPYKGPYRVIEIHPNGAEVLLIDQPKEPAIRIALNRVRRDPTIETTVPPLAPVEEPTKLGVTASDPASLDTVSDPNAQEPDPQPVNTATDEWRKCLRPRKEATRGRVS